MTLRVCYFTDSTCFGGVEQVLLTLIRHLDRDRWQPTLAFHPSDGVAPLVERAQALDVELWPLEPMPPGAAGASRAVGLGAELRRRRPDVFHAHLPWPLAAKFALAAAAGVRVPAVVATHHLVPPFLLRRRERVQQRLLFHGVGRYIAVSADVRARLHDLFGWPERAIAVVHNGIDVAAFATNRPTASTGSATMTVLVAARLDPLKGHRYLFEAVAALPDIRLLVAGEGPERGALESLARQLGMAARVTFLGRRDDMRALLEAADIVALPSLVEGLPLVALEAMAAARPVVATRIGGTAEAVVDGRTGLLVPPADPSALGAALERLASDRVFARRLGKAGQTRVRTHFPAEGMSAATCRIYDELLDIGSGRFSGTSTRSCSLRAERAPAGRDSASMLRPFRGSSR